ncbi:MAG: aspartate/glutamate racemase family protein [Paracoccaceae bacterium]
MIVLINPNSTETMTQSMLATARQTAPQAQFEGWTSYDGPPAIQGRADNARALPPLLKRVQDAKDAQAIIIACFDDTGLAEARRMAPCPVVGIGQAAYHLAALVSDRFSVVTTLEASRSILEENITRYGLGHHLARVRASGVPVLDLEDDPEAAARAVIDEIRTAEREDDVDTVVLGCGGMNKIAHQARGQTRIRLIDGVSAAAHVASGLVAGMGT